MTSQECFCIFYMPGTSASLSWPAPSGVRLSSPRGLCSQGQKAQSRSTPSSTRKEARATSQRLECREGESSSLSCSGGS